MPLLRQSFFYLILLTKIAEPVLCESGRIQTLQSSHVPSEAMSPGM